jgi:hypothetical protein
MQDVRGVAVRHLRVCGWLIGASWAKSIRLHNSKHAETAWLLSAGCRQNDPCATVERERAARGVTSSPAAPWVLVLSSCVLCLQ